MKNYFATNGCQEPMHVFAYNGEEDGRGSIEAYHLDGDFYQPCKSAEFNFGDMLNDEIGVIMECPWCLKLTDSTDHIRKCSNYTPSPTEAEIRYAYSHPADQAKRDSLLREMQR